MRAATLPCALDAAQSQKTVHASDSPNSRRFIIVLDGTSEASAGSPRGREEANLPTNETPSQWLLKALLLSHRRGARRCCFSLLYCIAESFSPPPFGINTGANGAECDATGVEPMPICICRVRRSASRTSRASSFLPCRKAAATLTTRFTCSSLSQRITICVAHYSAHTSQSSCPCTTYTTSTHSPARLWDSR